MHKPGRGRGYSNVVDTKPDDSSLHDDCNDADAPLPGYHCSVHLEGSVSVRYERLDPFSSIDSPWTNALFVLDGTRLEVLTSRSKSTLHRRKYTLQHAEVGVASDLPKYEMVPKSAITALLPESVQSRLKLAEPHLFVAVRQYTLRLRVECDQILLRLKTWEDRAGWLEMLCAAIDISPPLEYRTEPAYHTLPRRRRRRAEQTGERAERQAPSNNEERETETGDPEADDLEDAMFCDDVVADKCAADACPPPDPVQEARFRRRCMPSLLESSHRVNDVVIRDGLRWRVDWNSQTMTPYDENPPSYEPRTPSSLEETTRFSGASAVSSIHTNDRLLGKLWRHLSTWSRKISRKAPPDDASSIWSKRTSGMHDVAQQC